VEIDVVWKLKPAHTVLVGFGWGMTKKEQAGLIFAIKLRNL
jgi:hypothetical protein